MIKEISTYKITKTIAELYKETNFHLGEDVILALEKAVEAEESPLGKEILRQLIENAAIASQEKIPICQDTGIAQVFLEIGQEIKIVGEDLGEAINEGIRQACLNGYLRASVVANPFERKNTQDNTPAVIHTEVVTGDKLKITVCPKGAGSENMSVLKMLKPSDGVEGIKKIVIEQVKFAGGNPCPPVVVGVGIGGASETALLLSKKALFRLVGQPNKDEYLARLEGELLGSLNNLGIGPQGLGGRVTALGVAVEVYPCHMASLPVAMNISCHALRRKTVVL